MLRHFLFRYKFSIFSKTVVTSEPAFLIPAALKSGPVVQIRRGYCQYTFFGEEDDLKRLLQKHFLKLFVYDCPDEVTK
jgi:hypothetical protein